MLLRSRNLNVDLDKPVSAVADEKVTVSKDGHPNLKRVAPSFPRDDEKEYGVSAAKKQLTLTLSLASSQLTQLTQPTLRFDDFDKEKELEKDIAAMASYAQDIFAWYRRREDRFKVGNYHTKQTSTTPDMRARIVDWLVSIQETFELNHETLYLAVKLFDLYMDKADHLIDSNSLQLVASACLLIASKFDERSAPLIDDFIYTSDGAFDRDQMMVMEREVFQTVQFDLGAPLSYRFLRRYSRVTKTSMETLTLARYILETSLMYLDFCRISESLIAAACFLLALRMERDGRDWSDNLEHYSGYTLDEVEPVAVKLNRMIIERNQQYPRYQTVYKKYCHEIFHNVARTNSLPDTAAEGHYMLH